MSPKMHRGLQCLAVGLLLVNPARLLAAEPLQAKKANPVPLKAKPSPDKLLASGESCLLNSRPAEGLMWYRQAALAGSVEAIYLAGGLFLSGRKSNVPAQSVPSDITEGVRWTFWAATNMHPPACRGMARIYFDGLGVKSNLVQAYAWMRLSSELDPNSGFAELDRLARCLDAQQIQEAQQLVGEFKSGQWPSTPCKKVVEGDARLTLNGITFAGRSSLAVINRRTLAEGETADLVIPKGRLTVTCLEIRAQSILVDIAGEYETRLLRLR